MRAAFERIYQQFDIYGKRNQEVLIQAYIAGEEYIVDVVMQNGVMRTGGIFVYEKQAGPHGAPLYRAINLLPYHGERQQALLAYSQRVLQALELQHGPAHIELKMPVDSLHPILIEVGARMHGGYGPVFSRYGSGISQLDLLLAWLADQDFSALEEGYPLHQPASEIFLISKQQGKVRDWPIERLLAQLPSAQWWSIWAQESGQIRQTEDLFSSPGVVVLSHPDAEVMARDRNTLLTAEKQQQLFIL